MKTTLAYTNRIRQLASVLKYVGRTIKDKEIAIGVLNGFPEHYDSLITALDTLGNGHETFSPEFVKRRRLQEEQHIQMRPDATKVKSEAAVLLTVQHNNKHSWSVPTYSHSHKRGHTSPRCFILIQPHLIGSDTVCHLSRRPHSTCFK